MSASITIRHNMEMAHRLYLTPGKCQQIHGHSWWVNLELFGAIDTNGLLESIEFGEAKRVFRHFLDTNFDHHLILNKDDPWTNYELPGLYAMTGDPTTENLAAKISDWARKEFETPNKVVVHETSVNAATVRYGHV